jgi:hypothetical protein
MSVGNRWSGGVTRYLSVARTMDFPAVISGVVTEGRAPKISGKPQKTASKTMTTSFKAPSKPQRPLPPQDSHVGRVCSVIDLGSHEQTDMKTGKKFMQRKLRIEFELPNARYQFEENSPTEPFKVGKDYTWSMDKKSNLRPAVEALRGAPFKDDAEALAHDASSLIGQVGLVTVEHATTKSSGKQYAKITGVSKLPSVVPLESVPAAYNQPVLYHTGQRDTGSWAKLPEFLQKTVSESVEFRDAM